MQQLIGSISRLIVFPESVLRYLGVNITLPRDLDLIIPSRFPVRIELHTRNARTHVLYGLASFFGTFTFDPLNFEEGKMYVPVRKIDEKGNHREGIQLG